jgi:hypothetical protein
MTRFTITCFCKKSNIRFRSPAGFGAEIIARVFCPFCCDRAPEEALFIRVEGMPRKTGLYAIDWNQGVLKYMAPDFHDHEHWYRDFFGKKKLIFDFIPPKSKKALYEIVGLKEEVDFTEVPSGERGWAEKPSQLPGKKRKGPKESYRPFSNYKGHR